MNKHDFFAFLDAALTPYHAADAANRFLAEKGFTALDPNADWSLTPGGRYLIDFNDGTIFAFVMPQNAPKGVHIIGAHTDSPALRVKPLPTLNREGMQLLNIEVYGGPLLDTWFDRPLAVAGLAYSKGSDWAHPVRHVITLAETVTIPSLAIHMKRDSGDINPQKELLVLWGSADAPSFEERVAAAAGIATDALLSHELYLVSAEPAASIGAESTLYQASRIDNLANTHAALSALADCAPTDHIALFSGHQHEEIGSRTRGGAAAPRLKNLLTRLGIDDWSEDAIILSCDQAHAVHPNYPEKADPALRPRLGKGPVLKLSASHSYATTPRGEAMLRSLCAAHDIPLQTFCNRADMHGGSTIGPIAETATGIEAIDLGAPMLAMHSIRELADLNDQQQMEAVMSAFLNA